MSAHKSFLLAILLLLIGLSQSACMSAPNYLDAHNPRYAGSYSAGSAGYNGALRVVTWNIKFSKNIDAAIAAFRTSPDLQNADALLLQEMNEEGVDAIARALKLNYVYYPASIHPQNGKDFGEAILSPWPLRDDAKVILPHYSPRNGQIRLAAEAWIQTPGASVPVYSVHTETAMMARKERLDQVRALLANVPSDARYVVIGGDFNTLCGNDRRQLLQLMTEAGFRWLTADADATVTKGAAGLTMDYIFARGLREMKTGVVASDASDHLPLWVKTTPIP